MKKIDLGQTIQILANIGVIAGIVFLGLELRQNNRLLTTQTMLTSAQYRMSGVAALYENPDLARAWDKALQGQPLTSFESAMLNNFYIHTFMRCESDYLQWRAGVLSDDDFNVSARSWSGVFSIFPGIRNSWNQGQQQLRAPGFVQYMNENVVGQ